MSERKHTRGEICRTCCCGTEPCHQPDCKGFIHGAVVEEKISDDGDSYWIHSQKCDTCNYESDTENDPVKFDDAD